MSTAVKNRFARNPENQAQAGFTLVETMVVMLIFAIVAGVAATSIAPQDRTPSPYDIGKKMQSLAFRARADAIFQSKRTAVIFNVKTGLAHYGKGTIIKLPPSQSMTILAGRQLVLSDERVVLAFMPDGSSSGAEITLEDDRERSALLKVNWLTGIPHLAAGRGQ